MTIKKSCFKAFVVAGMMTGLTTGCSIFSGDSEYYGYEDEFVYPEPDIIPSMPDDNPGRTVEQMLNMQPRPVNEIGDVSVQEPSVEVIAVEKVEKAETQKEYEHAGRFGSKEKISLRKGLNAPAAEIAYGSKKREEEKVVRPLDLNIVKASDADFSEKSEEAVLAEIVSPQEQKIEMIEVVKKTTPDTQQVQVTQLTAEILPKETVLPAVSQDSLVSEPRPEASASAPVKMVQLVPAAVMKEEPAEARSADVGIVLTPPTSEEAVQPIQLVSPTETIEAPVVLTQPAAEKEEANITLQMPSLKTDVVEQEESASLALIAPPPMEMPNESDIKISQNLALVTFPLGKTAFPYVAKKDVTDAANTLKSHPTGRLLVVGYDAPRGNAGSREIARERAEAVADALYRAGVPSKKVKIAAETGTPYGEESGNHVEIYLEYE